MRTVTPALALALTSLIACSDSATGPSADAAVTTDTTVAPDAPDTVMTDVTTSPDAAIDDATVQTDAATDATVPTDAVATDAATDDDAADTATAADTTPADTTAPDVTDTPPCAALEVLEGELVSPPLTLHLSGAASTGTIANWRWSIVARPAGSVAPLHDAAPGEVTFEAALGGTYTFRLDVLDAHGQHACDAAEVTVVAKPTAPIHLELVWDDNTADPTVDIGADLDLHVFDPDAVGLDTDDDGTGDGWFDAILDCAWFNPDPTWPAADGVPNPAPRLLRRDDAGYGPEVIAVEHPTPDRTYIVGFHVWDDSEANYLAPTEIRVWIDGVLKNKPSFSVPVSNHALERVMTVRWPSGQLGFPFENDGHFVPTSPTK